MDSSINQSKLLLMCLQLVIKSGIRQAEPYEWLKTLLYLHQRGWLYTGWENDKLAVVVAGYRIKEVKEDQLNILPEVSEGKILYVPFIVSFAVDQMLPTKLLQRFLRKDENKDIEEILIEDRKDDKIIRRKVHKGEQDGEKQEVGVTSDTAIPAGSELSTGRESVAGTRPEAHVL